MRLVVSNTGPLMHLFQAQSLGVALWAAAAGHLNRPEAEAALNGLATSTLWLSARVLKEAKDALDQIFPAHNS